MHIEIVYLSGSGPSSSGMLKSLAAVTVASPADASILSCDSVLLGRCVAKGLESFSMLLDS